ncbi:MAG TPA: tail fiber domain-containing protein [Dongiaceae bacterium]|nr:tail fiber domain-containing protein [Dongiaceae bacterium]
MKRVPSLTWPVLLAFSSTVVLGDPLGTAITYQGRLAGGGQAANGVFDFRFAIYDAAGNPVAGPLTNAAVGVADGIFTTTLDFGSSTFTGDARWLEIAVRTNGSAGEYHVLTPRQALTPAPYALWTSRAASVADGAILLSALGQNGAGNGQVIQWSAASNAWVAAPVAGSATPLLGYKENGPFAAQPLAAGNNAIAQGEHAQALGNNSVVGGGLDNLASQWFTTVGGGWSNVASGFLFGRTTVAGGEWNQALGDWSTVGGGQLNSAGGPLFGRATVAGGWQNSASGDMSTISGGSQNLVVAGHGVIGGGQSNTITTLQAPWSTIGGGHLNQISAMSAAIGGGVQNTVSGWGGVVAGGNLNLASGYASLVGGGELNEATNTHTTVGGGNRNMAEGDASTVGGGNANGASGDFATVSGGEQNSAEGPVSTVGGGSSNVVQSASSTVSGGAQNMITPGAGGATIAGGNQNLAGGYGAAIGGGRLNSATNEFDVVAGGTNNLAGGSRSTVGGGDSNQATGAGAFVGGGGWDGTNVVGNTASGDASVVGGGSGDSAWSYATTVGGGALNVAGPACSTVSGGYENGTDGRGTYGTIGGGYLNYVKGPYATVPGGYANYCGGECSFAAGRHANAGHDGTFVWADNSTDASLWSSATNQFIVRATGGIYFMTKVNSVSGNPLNGMYLSAGGSGWNAYSDRNAKANFSDVDACDVLERLSRVPVKSWNYKAQDSSVRHLGPMAQDFNAAFGTGEADKTGEKKYINSVDADGVALAAIQGLNQKVEEKLAAQAAALHAKDAEIEALNQRLDALEQRLAR